MNRVEVSLREAVQMVADNNVPALDDPRFQSAVERLHQAESRGYLTGVVSRTSKRRDTYGQYLDVVAGRLTADGRDYLAAQPDIDSSSGVPIQAAIDDFCRSRIDLWNHRNDDSQHEAQQEAARRGMLNSSIHFSLRATAYMKEGLQRIDQIKEQVIQQFDAVNEPVNADEAARLFERVAKHATTSLRRPLEQLIQQRGLSSGISKQHFDEADKRIASSIKAAAGDIRSHIVVAMNRRPMETSLSGVTASSKENDQAKTVARRLWSWIRQAFQWTIVKIIAAIIAVIVGLIVTKSLTPLVDRFFESKASTEVGGAEAPPSRSADDE